MLTGFTKLPEIGNERLRGEQRIAVGFGAALFTKDGETIWYEGPDCNWDDCMTVSQAEEVAAADADHDWRIALHAPLRGAVYQRHGAMQWVLVQTDDGFA